MVPSRVSQPSQQPELRLGGLLFKAEDLHRNKLRRACCWTGLHGLLDRTAWVAGQDCMGCWTGLEKGHYDAFYEISSEEPATEVMREVKWLGNHREGGMDRQAEGGVIGSGARSARGGHSSGSVKSAGSPVQSSWQGYAPWASRPYAYAYAHTPPLCLCLYPYAYAYAYAYTPPPTKALGSG